MKLLGSIAWVLFFYALGEFIALLIGQILPGSVIGMLLFFVALQLGWVASSPFRPLAAVVSRYMSFFFLPAGVGVMAAGGLIADYWWQIALIVTLSTIAVLLTVSFCFEAYTRRRERRSTHPHSPTVPHE